MSRSLLYVCMNENIVFEVVTPSCHLTPLGQFYVNSPANPPSHRLIEVFALPGVYEKVLCSLYSGRLRVSHLVDEICEFPLMLTLKTFD
jgi:hypothetical protein